MTDAGGPSPLGQDTAAPIQVGGESGGSGGGGNRITISSLNDIPAAAAYLRRIGAEPVNFRTADVRSDGKYPRVQARLRFSPEGDVELVYGKTPLPEPAEVEAIKAAFRDCAFPTSRPFLWTAKHLPKDDERVPWSKADPGKLAVCWDKDRQFILFVQERVDPPNGDKFYRPWSYWSDSQWRQMEPEGKLPLFGMEQLNEHSIVCLHEGAKAALAVRAMLADPVALSQHPWGEDFKHMAHLAWLGGAERPSDTDWEVLRAAGVKQVVVVCDNDSVGKNVVRPVSRALQLPMDALFFDEQFPVGFDLADPFPAALFEQRGATRKYVGPSFTDCCQPATWATQLLQRQVHEGGRRQRGQTGYAARRDFAEEWHFVNSLGLFVHRRKPTVFLNPEQFNNAVRHVSDVKNTADLLHLLPSVKVDGVCYRPAMKSGVVTLDGERKFNTHVPSRVGKAQLTKSNWVPFYRFMTHLFPDKADRLHAMRWCATLIAQPDVRMGYGALLCTTTNGVGKSTLTDHILAPLVGPWNVSHPDVKRAVNGGFNGWLANNRLVVLAEMYVGHLGSKAYDTLKPLMTDKTVTVNEKFRPEYELENFAHFVASSNSRVPMFMAGTDRRWFVPKVTEKLLRPVYWRRFYSWLADGGLEIIHAWAFAFVEKHGAVAPEDHAPSSSAKAELVEASLSDGVRLIRDLAELLKELGGADEPVRVIVPLDVVKEWFAGQEHLSLHERKISGRAMLDVFEGAGLHVRNGDHRVRIGRRKVAVVTNFMPSAGEEWSKLVKGCLWNAARLREVFDEHLM